MSSASAKWEAVKRKGIHPSASSILAILRCSRSEEYAGIPKSENSEVWQGLLARRWVDFFSFHSFPFADAEDIAIEKADVFFICL